MMASIYVSDHPGIFWSLLAFFVIIACVVGYGLFWTGGDANAQDDEAMLERLRAWDEERCNRIIERGGE